MKNRLKKTLSMILIGIILVSLFPGGAWAQEGIQTTAIEGDYTYEVVGGSATITKYNGTGGNVTVPTSLGGVSVNKIGNSAFSYCSNLTSISLPEGLTSIGNGAFAYGHSLTSISLPQGLTSIGKNAFYDCSNLTDISLPGSCISIGQEAFASCDNLMSINLPEGLTSIGIGAFSNCSSLTSISLPKSLAIIDDNIFSDCSNLTSIIIPEGPTSIGYGAFSNCRSLAGISLPESCTSIDKYAFLYCISLTSISLPEGLTSIGDHTFFGCGSLMSIILPESLTSIGDLAFYGCNSLKSIQFNSAMTRIDDENDGHKTIPITTTIIAYDPSTAKDYAGANGNPFQLIGESAILESIAITTSAAKWSYNIGEALDLAGLVVTGTYSDGTTKIETITAANITGFDSSKAVGNQVLTITLDGKTAAFTIQIIASDDPVEGDFVAFLGQDPAGNYYEYNATDLSNAYLAYQINPTLPSAKMYQQFLNSKCQIVALKDLTKGYMDYNAAATASLMAQVKGEAFDINVYFGNSDAKKFTEAVENVNIVDKDGNVS